MVKTRTGQIYSTEKKTERRKREREKKVEGEIPANVELKRRRDPALSERRQTASRTVDREAGRREAAGEPVSFNRHLKILEPLLLEK